MLLQRNGIIRGIDMVLMLIAAKGTVLYPI